MSEEHFDHRTHVQNLDQAVVELHEKPELSQSVSLARRLHADLRGRAFAAAHALRMLNSLIRDAEHPEEATSPEKSLQRMYRMKQELEHASNPKGPWAGLELFPEIENTIRKG